MGMKKTDWTLLEPKKCEFCNSPYFHRKRTEKAYSFKKRRFCSNNCKMKWVCGHNKGKKAHNNRQMRRVCINCGKIEFVSPAYACRPYCSRKCMKNDYISGKLKGSNHWNWKGGITEDVSRDVLYSGYKDWRRCVFKRDDFRCVLCGNNKSGQLQAHHIKPVKNYKTLILDVSNGITVCKKCHKEIHYGKNKD